MSSFLNLIESRLVWLVIIVTGLGLAFPAAGQYFESATSLLLAMLMFIISLTFDMQSVRSALAKPSRQVWAVFLVYGSMSLAGLLTGRLFFGSNNLATGQTLLGTLPTDVSSPLLVLMARGNVALAAVLNAINTALSPFIVPLLFLWLTGIQLSVPLDAIILELTLIVLVPSIAGVSLRTFFPYAVARLDAHYAGIGAILYLLILLAVIGPNAQTIIGYGWYALVIFAAALALNLIGYLVGMSSRLFTNDRKEVITYLFTVSKKEFSIAAAFVAASGLPAEVAIPAAFFAVVQMLTSPIAAKVLARG